MTAPIGTVFGPDLSGHNSNLDFAAIDALSDVHLITHKITEGVGWTDPTVAGRAGSLQRFAAPGFYHVLWPTNSQDNPINQAHWYVDEVIRIAPWMLAHPCPVLQGDFELFSNFTPNRAPTIAECNAFQAEVAAYWRSKGGNPPAQLDYAPHWLYGSAITGLKHLWWASSYVPGSGPYHPLYPGNSDARWTQIPSRPADILQYSDKATFGTGAVSVDANGVRGVTTAAELQQFLLGGGAPDMPITDAEFNEIQARCLAAVKAAFIIKDNMQIIQFGQSNNDRAFAILDSEIDAIKGVTDGLNSELDTVRAQLGQCATKADLQAAVDKITAAIGAIPPGGGGPVNLIWTGSGTATSAPPPASTVERKAPIE